MKIEQTPERIISSKIIAANEASKAAYLETTDGIPSGKLTASLLGDPVQWQILKMIGVSAPEPDEYVLRLFKRGEHVEEWFTEMINPLDSQIEIEYMGVTGRLDALVDTSRWENKVGEIPLEVKSVKNSAFKWITGSAKRPGTAAKRGHKLQATLYALAMGADRYAITYIAADDYRTITFVYKTEELADEVRKIIGVANAHLAAATVPEFEIAAPGEEWQANPQYCKYPSFQYLTEEEILEKLLREQPEAWKRLMGLKEVKNA